MPAYRIGRLKGRFVVNIYDDRGIRINRYRLNARDQGAAQSEAATVFTELTRPKGTKVKDLWMAFVKDHAGRAIIENMEFNWKSIAPSFGDLEAEDITIEHCRAYVRKRRRSRIKPGTIATELGRLRMVLNWSVKRKLITVTPYIEKPSPPRRRDVHLTREQCAALIRHATMPHSKVFIVLALATGARDAALRDLTWERCDFKRGRIDLRNPEIERPHKQRAIVPMNRGARAVLVEAKEAALSDYVIEWAGGRIGSVKRGLKSTARAAGVTDIPVSPHIFRHSAAVHMAEAGIAMEEIAQFLGHEDVETTRRKYARFSPLYLAKAASALEYDDLGSMDLKGTTFSGEKIAEVPEYMVGATGIEPVTPTMSKKRA